MKIKRNQTPFKPKQTKSLKKSKVVKSSPEKSEDDGKNYISLQKPRKSTAVVYLGSIPHGFYEQEMRKYFSQFGKVLRTRVARSSKTGRSKGFGYVEFADAEVAKIVADTMNNYLMDKRIIKAKVMSPNRLLFFGDKWSEKNFPMLSNRKEAIQTKNKRLNLKKEARQKQRKLDRLNKLKEKLSASGYDLDLEIVDMPSSKNPPSKIIEVVSEKSSNSSEENGDEDDVSEEQDSEASDAGQDMEDDDSENDDSEEDSEVRHQTSDTDEDDDNSDESDDSEMNDSDDSEQDQGQEDVQSSSEDDVEEEDSSPKFSSANNRNAQKSKRPSTTKANLLQRKAGGGVTKRNGKSAGSGGVGAGKKFPEGYVQKMKMAAGAIPKRDLIMKRGAANSKKNKPARKQK